MFFSISISIMFLLCSTSDAMYLRAVEAGKGKHVGLPLTDGFVLCPAKFGPLTIECVASYAKHVDIYANKYARREYEKPFTLFGDYPGALCAWDPPMGQVILKCSAFTMPTHYSIMSKGVIDCPPGLQYMRNATHVYATHAPMKKPSPSPKQKPKPSPETQKPKPSPKSKGSKKKTPSYSPEPSPLTKGMRLRLVHAGYKGDMKTIAVLKDGFKIQDVSEKSVICDAPVAKRVTFFVNGKKWRVETKKPFSIDGDVGAKILKWKKVPVGRVSVVCECSSGMKTSATGTISK